MYGVGGRGADSPVGALAIDERQGDLGGWAVDYETTAAAREVATEYLDGAAVESLRSAGASSRPAVTSAAPASQASPAAPAELEGLFWQSIVNSTNPSDFEASLAQNSLAAQRAPANDAPSAAGTRVTGGREPGAVFRDCEVCPEMVVQPGDGLALGRYEVTVGEYRAFASATGGGAGGGGFFCDSWRDPGFPQTDRHPVACVSWGDAQEYVSWLSRTTGVTYRLPTEAEWDRAAAGSQPGCYDNRTGNSGTCPVGSYGSNAAGLSDMVGNLWEWTVDCFEGNCVRRVLRGGSWNINVERLRPGARNRFRAGNRYYTNGFRVSRTL